MIDINNIEEPKQGEIPFPNIEVVNTEDDIKTTDLAYIEYRNEVRKIIKKKNEVIQQTRSDMSELEQRIFGYACLVANSIPKEEIVPDQELKVTFRATDYYNYYGITDGGANYDVLRETLRDLRNRTMEIRNGKNYKVFGFINNGDINEEGLCEIIINKEMVPMITGIDENAKDYTKLEAFRWAKMKGKYTIPLCQYFISRYDKQMSVIDKRPKKEREQFPMPLDITISVENLRLMLKIEKLSSYKEYKKLNSKILKHAIEEINKYSEITVSYVGERRPIDRIRFTICRKAIIDMQ